MIESLIEWIAEHAEFYKDKGSADGWVYKEDIDGNIETYRDITNNVDIDTGNAPVYYNSKYTFIDIPDFINPKRVSIEWISGGGGIIFPYATLTGQQAQITYVRFYGGKANMTIKYRLKIYGTRKS